MWLLQRVPVVILPDLGQGRLSTAVERLHEGGDVAVYGVAPCYIATDLQFRASLEITVASLLGLLPPIWVLFRPAQFLLLFLGKGCLLDEGLEGGRNRPRYCCCWPETYCDGCQSMTDSGDDKGVIGIGSSHVMSPCGPGILGGMVDLARPRSWTASLAGLSSDRCYAIKISGERRLSTSLPYRQLLWVSVSVVVSIRTATATVEQPHVAESHARMCCTHVPVLTLAGQAAGPHFFVQRKISLQLSHPPKSSSLDRSRSSLYHLLHHRFAKLRDGNDNKTRPNKSQSWLPQTSPAFSTLPSRTLSPSWLLRPTWDPRTCRFT